MTSSLFHSSKHLAASPDTETSSAQHKEILDTVIAAAGRVILGKEHELRLALACLIARGHLLIEDLPGVGKTTLAHVLAKTLGLQFRRIQFTSDLLPADILGSSVYDREEGGFNFHRGPIFAQLACGSAGCIPYNEIAGNKCKHNVA